MTTAEKQNIVEENQRELMDERKYHAKKVCFRCKGKIAGDIIDNYRKRGNLCVACSVDIARRNPGH